MGYEIDFIAVGDGQKSGDAIALRFGNLHGKRNEYRVVVVDAGFKASGGTQLVNHIKKYYNTDEVDLAISTHPDSDHILGLDVVLEELKVKELWMHQPWNHTGDISKMFKDGRVTDNSVKEALKKSLDDAMDMEKIAKSKKIPITEPFTGVNYVNTLFVIGPSKTYYENLLPGFRGTPAPNKNFLADYLYSMTESVKKIAETYDFETLDDSGVTTAENNSSVILWLTKDDRCSLLTADSGIPALNEAIKVLDYSHIDYSKLKFLQVPHHGSQRNIGPSILNKLIGPKMKEYKKIKTAFLSISKESDSKHPSKKVINAFRRRGAPVYETRGSKTWHHHDAPDRADYNNIEPLPFYNEVDE